MRDWVIETLRHIKLFPPAQKIIYNSTGDEINIQWNPIIKVSVYATPRL